MRVVFEQRNDAVVRAFLGGLDDDAKRHFRHAPCEERETQAFLVEGDRTLGYGFYEPSGEAVGQVLALEVRGKGWGRRFLAALCEHAAVRGLATLKSDVDPDNVAALVVDARLGFGIGPVVRHVHRDLRTPVLFLTYNRLAYSIRAWDALARTQHPCKVFVYDNGSTDGTPVWIRSLEGHPLFHGAEFSPENKGMNAAVNTFLRRYRDAAFFAKVDNDTLVEPDWLEVLLAEIERCELDAVSAWHWRPRGPAGTFADWARACMRSNGQLFYHDYCGGTAVVIRGDFLRRTGLLFEGYPCKLGDLTLLFRRFNTGRNVAWSGRSFARLLDLTGDNGGPSGDFPDYEREVAAERERGNAWWTKTGGVEGVSRWIEEQGGREPFPACEVPADVLPPAPPPPLPLPPEVTP